jgi:uncharacterized protein (TIGR03083 family)
MGDYGDAYRASRARLTALANQLDAAALEKTVPTCPEWRIKDVYAHLIGLVADVTAGNLDGAGSDAWTQKQVDDRADRTGPELIAEWDANGPGMETLLDGVPPQIGAQIVGDLATHEADIWGAIGRPEARDSDGVALGFQRYALALGDRIKEAGLPALRINDLVVGDGEPAASVSAGPFELFRALTGRRSSDQVRAFTWDGDPEPYVAIFSAYGNPSAPVIE